MSKKNPAEVPMPHNQSLRELMNLLKARTKLVYVVTHEENRFLEEFTESVTKPMDFQTWVWSSHQGLMKYGEHKKFERASGDMDNTWRANIALEQITKMKAADGPGTVFILRDLHTVLAQGLPRQMRDALNRMRKKTIIVTAPELGFSSAGAGGGGLPLILDKDTVVVEYDLMGREEIDDLLRKQIAKTADVAKRKKKTGKLKVEYTEAEIEALVRACQGLTEPEIQTAVLTSLCEHKELNLEKIIHTKEQLVRKSQILEFVRTGTDMNDVGGLDQAKNYFNTYRTSFSDAAKEFGVQPPSGILLTGVPGTGKSLFAKAVCQAWGLPGIRLDIGKVMTGLVGGSEQRMREAIKQAEALAPCVLWIDEVEKAMSGVKSSNFSDAGTMSRVFGTFLTWMQEKTAEVVVLATANDITQVPPEFIRRFNEVFFVDMPVNDEREEIFEIHLRKRGRDIKNFNIKDLVTKSQDYTGAEIEKAVQHGLASAFQEGADDVKTEHILASLNETKPIFKVMGEKIREIRQWAQNRARYASTAAEEATHQVQIGEKKCDIEDLDLRDVTTPDVEAKRATEEEEPEDLVL